MIADASNVIDKTNDTLTWVLVAIVGIIVVGGLVALIVKKFGSFKRKLSYLNMEIGRTSGEERRHWKRRRRRLWINTWVPFVKKRH